MESCEQKPLVLITNRPPLEHFSPLEKIADLIFGPEDGSLMCRDEVMRLAPNAMAIINQAELKVDAELLEVAHQLKIVANVAAGTDNMDLELMVHRGVWGTNTPDVFVDSTADGTLAVTLALLRKIVLADSYVRSGDWVRDGFRPGAWDGVELSQLVWGVVGFGKIGAAVARRAEAFGCSVLVTRRTSMNDVRYRDLEMLLSESDIVSLHVPLNSTTARLIDAQLLRRMKPNAVLVNMSRGSVVVEQDLIAALQQNKIAGAAIDVFENEPHVDDRLKRLSNVILTPHLGGGTLHSRRRGRRLCAANVAAVLQGIPPSTPVNQLLHQK
jgi:glyoxylate reductase